MTGERPHTPGYVPALDGLRAIAVILVILFHLRVGGFAAGYLGVDMFFVLSGFLITSLLLGEIDRTGRLGLSSFWGRRARRLMPALLLLLLVVAIVAWGTATTAERSTLRFDLLSSTGYVANWHFIDTTSYFNSTGWRARSSTCGLWLSRNSSTCCGHSSSRPDSFW